jgi:DNA uptake protein ComE-like DNA-binding protein
MAPDWQGVFESVSTTLGREPSLFEFFERLGAKAIFMKCLAQGDGSQEAFLLSLRDHYYQVLFAKMLGNNQNLKRFFAQRKVDADWQKGQVISMSQELALKMSGVLVRHLQNSTEDGFKVLLPAYVQRSVHNAVVDYIKEEWQWEKETLQDLNLDPEMEDPRSLAACDQALLPENLALSQEQIRELNLLRTELKLMLEDKSLVQESLAVVDLIFGLGLTPHSKPGVELTMREVCEILELPGETQARKIARCQVLLDKGLDQIRKHLRKRLPGVAHSWQADVNVNTASRRELTHQLGLTEGEVDRLILARQYYKLQELVERGVIKANKVEDLISNGAVAAFVPVEINGCTIRDMMDILGFAKEMAQQLSAQRPFASLLELKKVLGESVLQEAMRRGMVLKPQGTRETRLDLNRATKEELHALGLDAASCELIGRGRPFATWAELEDFLCPEADTWRLLRKGTCLTIT